MRLRFKENIFRCAVFCECVQNGVAVRVVDTCRQLAVRKCSGTALAELYVRACVQLAAVPKTLNAFYTPVNVLAPLEYKRSETVFRKRVCAEKSSRACADNYGTVKELFAAAGKPLRLLRFDICDVAVSKPVTSFFSFLQVTATL